MKRRTFLTVSGTVGIAGAVSGASIVSSVYSSMSTSILLEEFNAPTKQLLDKFMENVAVNAQELGLGEKFVKQSVIPVQILSKKSNGNFHTISYKNKFGNCISLSTGKGVEKVLISNK